MAHHVCPRSNARLIEEVTRSKDRTTHDTRYEGYETRPRERNWSERTSFVRLRFFVSRESHFHAFIICNLIWSPALSNSPVELDKGKKKNSGTLYTIIYIYIYPRTKQRVREEILFPPLSSFLFFVRRLRPTRGVRPGRVSLPLRCLPHRECFSVVSWNLMDIRAELYVIRRGEGRQGLFWWSICAIGREEGGHELGQDSFIRLPEFCF